MVERFAEVARRADARGLVPLLAPGVRLATDGGDARYGKARALTKPLVGAEAVARFLAAVQKQAPRGLTTRVERVNGRPALLSYLAGALTAVLWFRVLDDRIEEIILVSDPERLAHVRARWPHASVE